MGLMISLVCFNLLVQECPRNLLVQEWMTSTKLLAVTKFAVEATRLSRMSIRSARRRKRSSVTSPITESLLQKRCTSPKRRACEVQAPYVGAKTENMAREHAITAMVSGSPIGPSG